MFKKIEKIDNSAELWIDNKTGIAVIRDGATGLQYSCHPKIDKNGSVLGMKRQGYWDKNAKTARAGGFIYNISSFVADTNDKYERICGERCMCEMCRVRRKEKGTKKSAKLVR